MAKTKQSAGMAIVIQLCQQLTPTEKADLASQLLAGAAPPPPPPIPQTACERLGHQYKPLTRGPRRPGIMGLFQPYTIRHVCTRCGQTRDI